MINNSELIDKIKSYNRFLNSDSLNKAYSFALDAHQNQKRDEGVPYIIHPVAVANILTELKLDSATIATGLLHDTIEDTDTDFDSIKDRFGKNSYDLLLAVLDKKKHLNVLDIACGSGFLLNLCHKRFGSRSKLTGIDMSYSELELARKKLHHTNTKLHLGMAQDLSFLKESSFDAILCH